MTKTAWRYEIKYGPEGEANYAWVYDADGEMVCTAKTHHAKAIVTRMNALASLQGEDAVERVKALAHRFWSIHPSTIAAMNLTREEFYAREMMALLATGLVAGEAAIGQTDPLDDLVARFSAALLEKLKAAREKYGYGGEGWRDDDWMEECQIKLISHLVKGDPRDVAAYCAFMWHHGWSTIAPDDELNGCRAALHKATVKNAQNEAKISDLNDMVLRYMHRAETNESAIRADEREKCAEIADCMADEYDATSFTSTNADQVAALRSKEQAAHEIAAAIRAGRDEA